MHIKVLVKSVIDLLFVYMIIMNAITMIVCAVIRAVSANLPAHYFWWSCRFCLFFDHWVCESYFSTEELYQKIHILHLPYFPR